MSDLHAVWPGDGPPPGEEATVITPPSSQPGSLLETLRQRRSEQAVEHAYDLEVPGYDGCLVLRLAPLAGETLSKLVDRAQKSKSPTKEFNANADMILLATQEVLGRRSRGDELESVDPDGGTVRIDERLAELFGLQASTAREVLVALWEGVPSPEIAIGLAAAEFIEWSGEAGRENDEAFLGESGPVPS
jgi:hypothetical protein